jgi:DedD protein
MERRVKERLIGAGILVALAVIVVPELLSGPKPEAVRTDAPAELPRPATAPAPVRNVTMDLTTSKPLVSAAQAAAPPPSPPPSLAPAPALPSASANNPDAPATAPSESSAPVAAPAPPAPSLETSSTPPKSAAGYAVQLGSFANRSNADNLVHQLKAQGFAVYMLSEGSGKAARYRVRVGPLNDRDAAERTIARLKSSGHASTLVAPR